MVVSRPVARTVLQLRVGATRDRGFLFRTCVRPPATITIGRGAGAVLPIDDPSAPVEHPLFSIGAQGCLVDCRPEWGLTMYRDEGTVTGDQLLAEGTAMQTGRRILMRVAPGSRGALSFGAVRLLFKWEVVPEEQIGEVPPSDLGAVPRCHACGLALRDALAREPLLARCDACRALNRFVDPDGPHGRAAPPPVPARAAPQFVETEPDSSQSVATVSEERDTLLAVPIFAPLTTWNLNVLPQHAQPAGRPGLAQTPLEVRVAKNPVVAVEQMQTVLSKSPFMKRPPVGSSDLPPDPSPMQTAEPASVEREEQPLDDLFYTAEVEALGLQAPVTLDPETGLETGVPWGTMSVLSANAMYQPDEGRIPRREVARAVHRADEQETGWFAENAALIAALSGIALLVVGIVLVADGPVSDPPPRPDAASHPPAAQPRPQPSSEKPAGPTRDAITHPTSTYVKFLPGDPTPISIRVAGFAIDRTEVTTRAFERFLSVTGARRPDSWSTDRPEPGSREPVTGVTLDEARSYCRWAGGRLPTEPEWERAAAGTYGRMYPWGNSFLAPNVSMGPRVQPVGSFPAGASESGVQDLIGNAVEWVEPAWSDDGFLKGGGAGSWAARGQLMVFGRIAADAADWRPGPGFRCAFDP